MGRKSGRGGDSRLGLFDVRGHGMFAGDWAALWTERWSEWSRSRAGGGGGCAACPRDGVAPPRGARARRGGAVGRGGGGRFVRGAVPCWLRRVHLSGVAGCAAARAREVERLHDDGLTVPILSRPPRSSCSSLHARAGVAHAPAPLVVLGAACLRAAPVHLVVATSPDYRSSSSLCADAARPCA